jgi:hypothetical protein
LGVLDRKIPQYLETTSWKATGWSGRGKGLGTYVSRERVSCDMRTLRSRPGDRIVVTAERQRSDLTVGYRLESAEERAMT